MLISDITNSGAIPTLELAVRFAAARNRIITHNIANISTPEFIDRDLAPADFQRSLREAVEARRKRTGGEAGVLGFAGTRQFRVALDGQPIATAEAPRRDPRGNILFHDRNNRDLERLMQATAETVGAMRVATDLLRTRYDILRAAIAERA